jgi:diguanylate cyclase (GGDEF)-like protein
LAERLARQAFVAHHAQHLQGHADRASQAGGVTTDALSLGGHTVPVSGAQGIQSGIGGALAISPGRAVTPGQASNSPSAVGSSGVPLRGALAAITPGTASTRAAQTTSTKARPAKSATSTRHAATPHRPLEPPSVIQRIERVVPGFVWLALGISAALAALGGGAMFWSGYRMRSQAGEFAAVAAAALTDPLTGVLNRRGFIDAAERELSRARRYDRPFVLAYVDVRGLKAVNDSEGHQAGDRLLTAAAQLLRESARADDVVGRLGGDEMGVLLVEQSGEGAQPVIDRIHKTVAARRSEVGLRSPWDLTIGTATYPTDGKTVKELLATADRRLYEQRGIALT